MSAKQKFCGECGTGLPDGAVFCGECGTAVPNDSGKHGSQDKKKKKKQNTTSKPASNGNGFKLVPLLIWAGIWNAGGILALLINILIMPDFYYFGRWLEGLLLWLAVGLIAAALLQWFNITSRRPTAKMALLVTCAWFAFNSVMQWMHQTYNLIPMAIAGSLVGACLAWIITKQVAGIEPGSLSTESINKLIGGWALCGACVGFPSWFFPFKLLIGAVLFIAVLTTIVIKRAR